MSRERTWRSNTAGRKVRTSPLLLKGARDHAPSHDVEHGDCENGQLRITRNAPDRYCDHGSYDCDDDFGLDFGHATIPPERDEARRQIAAGPRAPVSPIQRTLSRPIIAQGGRSLTLSGFLYSPSRPLAFTARSREVCGTTHQICVAAGPGLESRAAGAI